MSCHFNVLTGTTSRNEDVSTITTIEKFAHHAYETNQSNDRLKDPAHTNVWVDDNHDMWEKVWVVVLWDCLVSLVPHSLRMAEADR